MSNGAFYFYSAFQDCEKLTANSIKVPAEQLEAYKDNADVMEAQADRFAVRFKFAVGKLA